MTSAKNRKTSYGFWQKYHRHVEVALVLAVVLLTLLQVICGNIFFHTPWAEHHDQPLEATIKLSRHDALDAEKTIRQNIAEVKTMTHDDGERVKQTMHFSPEATQATSEDAARAVRTSLDNQARATPYYAQNEDKTTLHSTLEVVHVTHSDTQYAADAAETDSTGVNEPIQSSVDEENSLSTAEMASSNVDSTSDISIEDQVLATVAQDRTLRKQAFMNKYIDCKETNKIQPIGDSCALKLKVRETAADSMEFDYMETKQEKTLHKFNDPPFNGKPDSQRKTILVWRIEWSLPQPDMPETLRPCPVCRFITNESDHNVDAVIMSSFDYMKSNFTLPLPTREAYPRAKMVVYEYEPPSRSGAVGLEGLVDYVIGYRRDSDIVKTNGYVFLRTEPISWDSIVSRNAKKFKTAAWFVTNCRDEGSERRKLAKTLQKYGVQVDIYGRCGDLECPKKEVKCLEMLETDYKFYFSFENSLCNHYVTEKFYKALTYSVVPITYGLGHELTGAPKSSYIDVFDFHDVKSLADYILYLDSNTTAYNEYFRWQLTYEADVRVRLREHLCELCQKLVEGAEPENSYANFASWVGEGQCIDVNDTTAVGKFIRGRPWDH